MVIASMGNVLASIDVDHSCYNRSLLGNSAKDNSNKTPSKYLGALHLELEQFIQIFPVIFIGESRKTFLTKGTYLFVFFCVFYSIQQRWLLGT